jgi:hypothetical protein
MGGSLTREVIMLSSMQRKRLLEQMKEEPEARNWIVLSKCGAGLAIIVLLGFIGASAGHRDDDPVQAKETATQIQAAEEHRRKLFDERRARFEQQVQRNRLARQQSPSQSGSAVKVQ